LFASLSLHFSILYFPFVLFFFKHTAPTAIYTLSLHDALPIFLLQSILLRGLRRPRALACLRHAQRPGEKILEASDDGFAILELRSEEHTSELQSRENLVCRLLLEKKKKKKATETIKMKRIDKT